MTSSIKELTGPVPEVTPEEAVRAAACVIRHSSSIADAERLLEIIGLEAPVERCADCGYLVTAPGHKLICGEAS